MFVKIPWVNITKALEQVSGPLWAFNKRSLLKIELCRNVKKVRISNSVLYNTPWEKKIKVISGSAHIVQYSFESLNFFYSSHLFTHSFRGKEALFNVDKTPTPPSPPHETHSISSLLNQDGENFVTQNSSQQDSEAALCVVRRNPMVRLLGRGPVSKGPCKLPSKKEVPC